VAASPTGALALPAPTAAATPAAATPAPSVAGKGAAAGQAVLPQDVVQGLADAYAQERIYLAKCQQLVVMMAGKCGQGSIRSPAGSDVCLDGPGSCRA
jgi:hypothetical protein